MRGRQGIAWRPFMRRLAAPMFLFFSNRLGCIGSILVSVALSALLYFLFMR